MPFSDNINVEIVAQKLNDFHGTTKLADLEEEIINIKCDIKVLKSLVSDCIFLKLIRKDKYPKMYTIVALCSAFLDQNIYMNPVSFRNAIKKKDRSQLTDRYL